MVRTVARRTGGALVLLLALAWLALALATRADAVRVSRVRTGSMTPRIPVGAIVVSRPAQALSLRPGQVIQFVPPAPYGPPGGGPVVHRIVDVATVDGTIVVHTKGDANATDDPWTLDASSSTVFRVAGQSAAAGAVADKARRAGLSTAIAVAAVAFGLRMLRTLWGPRGRRGAHRARRTLWPLRTT